jgi:CheY-like chemotaxis protein
MDEVARRDARTAGASAVEHNPPDLILLDITMPEMNGYEVCERLKAKDRSGTPVISPHVVDRHGRQGASVRGGRR